MTGKESTRKALYLNVARHQDAAASATPVANRSLGMEKYTLGQRIFLRKSKINRPCGIDFRVFFFTKFATVKHNSNTLNITKERGKEKEQTL